MTGALSPDRAVRELSEWVDSSSANLARDPEAMQWGRVAKVAEECGEVVSAFIGATGQNPRKGFTHTVDDVNEELFDVALTALAAHEHLSGNAGLSWSAFEAFVLSRHARVLGDGAR